MDKPNYTSQLVWVVRCKNCKYYNAEKKLCIHHELAPDWNWYFFTEPNWYCADGEWKDESNEEEDNG